MEREFKLKSFKFAFPAAEIKYTLAITDDEGITVVSESHVKDTRPLHNDLCALFDELAGIVKKMLPLQWEYVKITQVRFAGMDENIGIAISGVLQSAFGAIKFVTPRIMYLQGDDEVHAGLTVFCDKLTNEVNAYLFENKVAEIDYIDAIL